MFPQYMFGLVTVPDLVAFNKNIIEGSSGSEWGLSNYIREYKVTKFLSYGLGYMRPVNGKINLSLDASFGLYFAKAKWIYDEHMGTIHHSYDEEYSNNFIEYMVIGKTTAAYRISPRSAVTSGLVYKLLSETTTWGGEKAHHKFSLFIGLQGTLGKHSAKYLP